jgi:outer membrane receptor for ferrienterochelin and colicins
MPFVKTHLHARFLRLLAASPVLLTMCGAYAADDQSLTPVPVEKTGTKTDKPVAVPAAAKTPEQKLQQIEVKGNIQTYDNRRNDTATKIVVTQEEILKNGDTSIGEVLKRLPGITLGGVQGRGGDVRMRGLGAGYTQVLLNGEPSPPGFSMDSLSPDMIERIEIMRAATAEFSTQAVAGAINIILKKAIQTAQREFKFGAQSDSHKIGANLNLQLSDRMGPVSYSLNSGMIRSNYERLPVTVTESAFNANGTQTQLNTTTTNSHGVFESFNLAPRVNLSLGNGETITSQSFVNFNRFNGNNHSRTLNTLGAAPTYSGIDQRVQSGFNMIRSDLNWVRKIGASGKLDMKLGANFNERNSDADNLQLNAKDQLILHRLIDSSASDKGMSASGKFSTPYAQDHALAMGWDGGISNRNEDKVQRETSPVGLKTVNSDERFQASVKRLAIFAQDEWNVTPRWSVYYGLRWEGLDTTSEGNSYADVHNKSSVWSPIFQTLWKLPETKNDQIRFGLTRTYKAPMTNTLIPRRFSSLNNSPTSPDTQGNPNLKPELAWGLDLAYEHYLSDGGLLSASTFVRRIEDITRRSLSQMDGLWVSMPVNDGVATTKGIELEAKLPLRSLLKSAPAIEIRANVARNWSSISSVPGPNNRIDQQTPVSANFGLDYKMDKSPLTLGGNYSFQTGGPVQVTIKQSAYTMPKRVLDMYALWKFSPKVQLRMSLANGLHQNNISESTYVDANGKLQSSTLTPTTMVMRGMFEVRF